MEKPVRIVSQVYGYAVCLVAVIIFLISITALVTSVLDLDDPIHSGYTPPGSPSLASYENYKLDIVKSFQNGSTGSKETYTPTEETLRSLYEAARNDKIQSSRHQSQKSILISGLMIFISVALFYIHWRWMQRMTKGS
jgi:ATP-dependent Zn protease